MIFLSPSQLTGELATSHGICSQQEWLERFKNKRLSGLIPNLPPAEYAKIYCEKAEGSAMET
jgi:hypothetical protein